MVAIATITTAGTLIDDDWLIGQAMAMVQQSTVNGMYCSAIRYCNIG
jgi:hypothetical protein